MYGIYSHAQFAYWSVPSVRQTVQTNERTIHHVHQSSLDAMLFASSLQKAPKEFSNTPQICIIQLPMPDGSLADFRIFESPIAAPSLLKKYPFLKTYIGYGIHNPAQVVRLSFAHQKLYAFIRDHERWVSIEPTNMRAKSPSYISYEARQQETQEPFSCHTIYHKIESPTHRTNEVQAIGEELRIFEIAIATTGEYAQFHGGTVADALAAVGNTLNRVNLLFELETSTRFVLVENNDKIIFTDPTTDPYNNNSLNEMLPKNQMVLDSLIGLVNYDIGHVFGTRGGGLAGVGGVCSSLKAWGATGLSSPIGDAFDVVYVAHELGHQLNAPHSFNSCNGEGGGATAYEPGSGTSIMAYAGLCGSDNIQFATDYFFHSGSYSRIVNAGNDCADIISTNNTPPTVEILDPIGLAIPINTPFELTAQGFDADGDELVYTWEQMDTGPISPLGSPTDSAPLFRFFAPSSSSKRSFPNITDLINNTNTPAEVLPFYDRDLNFRVTVRDNKAGSGGVNFQPYHLRARSLAGPFMINTPNTDTTIWYVGEQAMVTWDVANTDQAPVRCSHVSIYLSEDGGLTFPHLLADSIPNIGHASVSVPNVQGTQCRIKIKGHKHIFFDISDANFTITDSPIPTFSVLPNASNLEICGEPAVTVSLMVAPQNGFNETISFEVLDLPAVIQSVFSPPTLSGQGSTLLLLSNLQNLAAGYYSFQVVARSSSVEQTLLLTLYNKGIPSPPVAYNPLDNSKNIPSETTLRWAATPNTNSYTLDLATSPNFETTLIQTHTISDTSFFLTNLDPFSVYYWRIKASNHCGESTFSHTYAFQTLQDGCRLYQPNDVPIQIEANAPNAVVSSIEVSENFSVSGAAIPHLQVHHDFLGDLRYILVAPNGAGVLLGDAICGNYQELLLGFDDAGVETIPCPPSTTQTFLPMEPFSNLYGESSLGTWRLLVQDNIAQDGGILQDWTLELCSEPLEVIIPMVVHNNDLSVEQTTPVLISEQTLKTQATGYSSDEIEYQVRILPNAGNLLLDTTPLDLGDTFTQADIAAGRVFYQNNTPLATVDSCVLDIRTSTGGWEAATVFRTQMMLSNNLNTSARIIEHVICHGASNAKVSLTPENGTPPYQYSMDSLTFQNSNIFGGLSAGNYTFWVQDAAGSIIASPTVEIADPPPLTVNTLVEGSQLTIEASGGTGTLLYSVDGVYFVENAVFTDLPNGFYNISVKDENDCRVTTTATIFTNTMEVTAQVTQPIQCHGAQDGKITATITGGTPPYRYSIDGQYFQSSPLFEHLGAGNYQVTVEEFEGFSVVSDTIELAEPSPLSVMAQADLNHIEVQATGGAGAYLYSLDGTNYQSAAAFSDLSNGVYTVYVQDSNGCVESQEVQVSYEALVAVATVEQPISCHGMSDAVIRITPVTGTPPYLYRLGTQTNFRTDPIFDGLSAGNYPFEIIDGNALTFEGAAVVVTEPPPLTLTATFADNQIEAAASGGRGNIGYSLDGENWQESPLFENMPTETYTIYARDESGCVATFSLFPTTAMTVLPLEQHFSIIPNPNRGIFKVLGIVHHYQNDDEWQISVRSIQGVPMHSVATTPAPDGVWLHAEALPAGVYVLIVQYASERYVGKFVKY